jgi:Domain of unknown function (DUF4932)
LTPKQENPMKLAPLQLIILFALINIFQVAQAQPKDQSVFIKDNKAVFELPAAYELIHIAFALTDTSNNASYYFNANDTSQAYYHEVIKYFSAYKNHALIQKLTKQFKKSYARYIYNLLKGYNSGLSENEISKDKRFPFFHGLMYSFSSVSRSEMEDFAKVSNFQSFYNSHQTYYKAILEDAKTKLNVHQIQTWLETQFGSKYDKYNLVISPLMHSTHFTRHFTYKGEKTSIMWVSDAEGYNAQLYSPSQIAGLYTGIVFSEIDHNYVNPVSDKYKKEINKIMGDEHRSKWIKANGDGKYYGTGYKVYNEYMTHAIYLIYTNELYSKADQTVIENARIKMMEQSRKYYRFGDFYRQLKTLYTSKQAGQTITDLYPKMLEWSKSQN